MSIRVYWSDETHVKVETSDGAYWEFGIRYPESTSSFAFGDGSLIEVTRKGGKPRVRVLEGGSSRYIHGNGDLTIDPEADVGWVARAWDYGVLAE